MTANNAILLARISSRDQLQGISIDAQLKKLHDYASAHHMTIIKIVSLIEQSSKGGIRKKFNAIVATIEKSPAVIALVVDTVDRMLRNFKDSIILDDLRKQEKVELHFLRENLILTRESSSADLIRWDMAILFAKSYILQMKDNVMRSIQHKIENGEIVNHFPSGTAFCNSDCSGYNTDSCGTDGW